MREKREKKIFLNSSVKNVSIIRKDPDKEEGCERERRYAQGFLFPFLYSWNVLNMHGFLRTKHFKSGIQFAQCWNDWMDLPTRKHLKTCDLTHSISTCTDSTSNARGTLRVWTLSRCPGHLATHLQSDSVKQVLLFSQLTSMRLLPTGRGLTVWAGIPPHVTSRAHLLTITIDCLLQTTAKFHLQSLRGNNFNTTSCKTSWKTKMFRTHNKVVLFHCF